MNYTNQGPGYSRRKPQSSNNLSVLNVQTYTNGTKVINNEDSAFASDDDFGKDSHKLGRVFTGSVERVMKWHRIYPHFCYYEVIASVIALQESPVRMQKMMLLRDRKGPILQVVYYSNDRININDFFVGQTLRCLGHMVGTSTLHALSIRAASDEELSTLQRMAYISEHAISRVTK